MKAKLDRELAKGKIPMEPTDKEEPIDGDGDMVVARAVEEVWKTYDPKNTGFMDKKNLEKFFKVRPRTATPTNHRLHSFAVCWCVRPSPILQHTSDNLSIPCHLL